LRIHKRAEAEDFSSLDVHDERGTSCQDDNGIHDPFADSEEEAHKVRKREKELKRIEVQTDFKAGECAEAKWGQDWYPVKIKAVNADGSYYVYWVDEDLRTQKFNGQLRRKKEAHLVEKQHRAEQKKQAHVAEEMERMQKQLRSRVTVRRVRTGGPGAPEKIHVNGMQDGLNGIYVFGDCHTSPENTLDNYAYPEYWQECSKCEGSSAGCKECNVHEYAPTGHKEVKFLIRNLKQIKDLGLETNELRWMLRRWKDSENRHEVLYIDENSSSTFSRSSLMKASFISTHEFLKKNNTCQ